MNDDELDLIDKQKAANMIHLELLIIAAKHFAFLERVAKSPGPLKRDGKIESKYKIIASECEAAYLRIQQHLKENP